VSVGITHFKLGLLTIVAIAAMLAAVVVLGLHRSGAPTVTYHTYFDESVQGLGTGSPVKFRGVLIGSVASISIAPDGRYVDVTYSLDDETARRLHIESPPAEVRARLNTQGLTGVKFIDIDFFPYAPVQTLPFSPAPRTIAAQPSLLKGVETAIDTVGQRVPDLIESATTAVAQLQHVLDDIDRAAIPQRIASMVDTAKGIVVDARRVVAPARALIANVDAAVTKAHTMFDRINGDQGLVAAAHEAIKTADNVGRRALGSTDEIDRTMRDIGEAAQALRDLLDELERDPDMIVKGRAKAKGR
jgi:paraquat-inducible protein B